MVLYYFFVKRRMLVSARRIGVPRKTERSDVLWGERLADLFKTSIRLSAKRIFVQHTRG